MITVRLIIRDREWGDIVEICDYEKEYEYNDAQKAVEECCDEYVKDMPEHWKIDAIFVAKNNDLWFEERERDESNNS